MLFFLDESYDRTTEGYLHILGGFAVPEEGHRRLVAQVQKIKRQRFVQDRNLTAEEREAVWQDHFIVGAPPHEVELKASLLLSSSILKRRSSIALRIATEVLDALQNAGATVHGHVSAPPTLRSGLSVAHYAVLDEVQRSYPERPIQVVLDTTNPTADQALARAFTEAVLEEPGRFPTLGPTPFILDTRTSPALQVADLVAHVLLHRARPEENRKPLQTLDARLRTMEKGSPQGR